jgi:hypothetical protein
MDLFIKLSSLIGPIFGAVLYKFMGYRKTLDIWMISLFTISIFYAIFNCGINVFKNN